MVEHTHPKGYKISFISAVELSFLSKDEQYDLLANEKSNQKVTSYVKWSSYDKYFPKTYTTEQKQKIVDDLLSAWAGKRERIQEI